MPPELDAGHVYHLFPVLSEAAPALQAHLTAAGVETLIHYPVPIPRQPALSTVSRIDVRLPTASAPKMLSLPLYPSLTDEAVLHVAAAVNRFGV